MDQILEILKEINIAQLAAIGCMFWFFYSRLDAKIDEVKKELKSLSFEVANIDKRVYGIERILEMKECCALKNDEKLKRAE